MRIPTSLTSSKEEGGTVTSSFETEKSSALCDVVVNRNRNPKVTRRNMPFELVTRHEDVGKSRDCTPATLEADSIEADSIEATKFSWNL